MPVTTKTDLFARKVFEHYKKGNSDSDLGIQNVFTPIRTIESAVNHAFHDFLTPETKNVAVIFNWEFFVSFGDLKPEQNSYIKNIKFTYFYDSELDVKMLRAAAMGWLLEQIELVNISEFTEQNKDFNIIEKAMSGKHFDIVFSNPPYNKNIDLQILQTMFNYADKIVFIHPSTFLLDKKFKKKLYNDVRNTNYLEKTILSWGNEMFNIRLFCPLAISVWNTNKETPECNVIDIAFIRWTHNNSEYTCNINDISMHSKYFQKVKHFLNCENNLQTNITDENKLTDYSVALPLIRGGSDILKSDTDNTCEHFTSILGLDYNSYKCDHTFRYPAHASAQQKLHYGFASEAEREHFLGYCKTKIVRFLLSITKINANLGRGELEVIPWMDFSQSWNDKKLCKEFNIDKELWQYIDNFIPDYYEDYTSGFEVSENTTENVTGKTGAYVRVSRHKGELPNKEMIDLCPAEVIEYLIKTPITNKSGFVSKSWTDENKQQFRAFKELNKNSIDNLYSWRVLCTGFIK